MTVTKADNYCRVNLKRKVFTKGKRGNFKRFKRVPKYVKDNVENQVAREKERDVYAFTDSEDELDDLGMGLEISDLPFLDDNQADKQTQLIALTQDSVRPLFANNVTFDENMLQEGLVELRHSTFRSNQKETIKRILFGRSTLFISPTGSGKSLCYQLPALLYWRYRRYMTFVVSPLISLMEDQISNFPASLKAISIHSGHNRAQRQKSIEQLVKGDAQVAFISPEAIVGGLITVDDLKNLPPVGFVCIDEAHCLSEWSHNFRPAYLQFFKVLHEKMQIKTYLGLTATATRATAEAIARHLNINPEIDIIGSTRIPDNLILSVSHENNKDKALIELLKSPTFRIMPSIIVYCNRREETEHVASRIRTAMQNYVGLIEIPERRRSQTTNQAASPERPTNAEQTNGQKGSPGSESGNLMKLTWHAESYHAGLASDARKRIQRQFIKGEIRVVVATIAFGMGINKSNVRAIIHYDMPSSFESYVQEIGRAGRDGSVSQCHLFLKAEKTDVFYQQRNIYSAITERKNLKRLIDYLFKPCRCASYASEEDLKELERKNEADKHQVAKLHLVPAGRASRVASTKSAAVQQGPHDHDADHEQPGPNATAENDSSPVRESLVCKHRLCKGHEVAFGVEEATEEVNLKSESIITLICQLQRAYPQLRLEQYTPMRSTCNLFCYHGPAQMEALSKSSRPVGAALLLHRQEQMKEFGSVGETPNKISFDVIQIAARMGVSSAEVVKMLKKTEWELVEKTGRFRRSQVRVRFEGNSFHLKTVGDLSKKELDELHNFLFEYTKAYESSERDRIAQVHNTFKRHSISVDQMKDKKVRLDCSTNLKAALNAYFDTSIEQPQQSQQSSPSEATLNNDETDCETNTVALTKVREGAIRRNARAFISAHGKEFNPRVIARIFQGISTPNHPAQYWGTNKRWWRIHLDVDFLQLASIIQEELLR